MVVGRNDGAWNCRESLRELWLRCVVVAVVAAGRVVAVAQDVMGHAHVHEARLQLLHETRDCGGVAG